MDELRSFLNQATKKVGSAIAPYQTNFSFLSNYPYETVKVSVPEWARIDGLGTNLVGTQYAWKLLCIFNDALAPMDLLNKDYLYLPVDFNVAVEWLRTMNRKQRRE